MKQTNFDVKQLQRHFHFEVIYSDELSINKKITTTELNRPGLELVGYYEKANHAQCQILGSKELNFLKKLSKERKIEAFRFIADELTPFILITHNNEVPEELYNIVKERHVNLFRCPDKGSIITIELMLYIYEKLSDRTMLHGTLVEMYGEGVLITGDSGIGKSEIALELIKKGHRFVADDAVMVHRLQNHVYGQPSEHLTHLLEVRGIGLIDVFSMFGVTAIQEYSEIDYVINLTTLDKIKTQDRLNTNITYTDIDGVKRPQITLPVTSGRSMANLVEAAVISLRLQTIGINPTQDFISRYDNILKGGK